MHLGYQNSSNDENQSVLIFEELSTTIDTKINQIIKDIFTIMEKEFPIIKKEINSVVVEV